MKNFEELLGKENPLLKAVEKRAFVAPTEIQETTIPLIVKGRDVIAEAATGSGKTLAFASGVVNKTVKSHRIQSLILTPTRELAEQVSKELKDFSNFKHLDVIAIYGGVSIENQIRRLERAEVVVGTPGRILDHIGKRSINLTNVKILVLDEADRMLDMGFIEDVQKIIEECPKKKQTLLFSATISLDIAHIAKKYMTHPLSVSAEKFVDPKKLEQVYYDVQDSLKYSLLKHLLEKENSKLIMIFCNTRKNVDFVAKNLKFSGLDALPIHGGLSQEKRNIIMKKFHSKKTSILVATDVAARGLHIENVSHIYNYDMPPTIEEYTHRIGRTARAGKEGKVINIIASRDYKNFNSIMMGDFMIKKEETPFVKRVKIRWMPEKKGERILRRQGHKHFGKTRRTAPKKNWRR